MLECQSFDVQEAFNLHLMEFLTDEQLLIWKLKKPIDSFVGGELNFFSKNAASLAVWAEKQKLVSSTNQDWTNMAAALKLWVKIHEFVTKAKIEEGDDYKEEIKEFEVLVKQFYEYSRTTFFASKAGAIGSMKTSYMHILRYNLATLARITFERHKVGIGVFTLQGYERRNKESKNIFLIHCNMKGNLCEQTMKGLTQQYDE